MGKVKAAWTVEQEFDDDWGDLIYEIQALTNELKADNDRAEEKENERTRQCFSVWEV